MQLYYTLYSISLSLSLSNDSVEQNMPSILEACTGLLVHCASLEHGSLPRCAALPPRSTC